MIRELSGTFKRGISYETARLEKQGRGFWSIHNEVMQVYAVTLAMLVMFAVIFGPSILWFLIPHHFLAWLALTQANYVEHYGLMRQKLESGKYERCQPIIAGTPTIAIPTFCRFTCSAILTIMPIRKDPIRCYATIRMCRACPRVMEAVSPWPLFRHFGLRSWLSLIHI